jgi:hypothetical protein
MRSRGRLDRRRRQRFEFVKTYCALCGDDLEVTVERYERAGTMNRDLVCHRCAGTEGEDE